MCFLLNSKLRGQTDDSELSINLNTQITDLLPEKVESSAVQIKINQLNFEEFESLGIFKSSEILEILSYRQKFGPFLHLIELQRLSIDLEMIREIRNRIDFSVSTKQSLKDILNLALHGKNKHQLILGTQSQLNPLLDFPAYYLKYTFNIPQIGKIGCSFQTDAYEKGIDFYSFSLQIKHLNKLQNLTIGRYFLSNNQGLVVAAPFPVGRRYALESWSHGIQESISHSGWNEDNGYWGISTEFNHRKSKTSYSLGYHQFDSEIQDSGLVFLRQIFGGDHVSELEKSRKNNNALIQTAISNSRNLKIGSLFLGGYFYHTKIPKFRASKSPKNNFSLLEMSFTTNSFLDGRIIANAAINDELKWAMYLSGIWSLSKEVSFGVRYQRIQTDYYSPELSIFKYDEINRSILDIGFDWNLNSRNELLIRGGLSNPIHPLIGDKLEKQERYTGLVWKHQFNKKDNLSFRIQQTVRSEKISHDMVLTWHISPLPNLLVHIQCLQRKEEDVQNWGSLNTIKFNYSIAKIAKVGFYFGQFHGNENILYTTIPSFTNRIQLGVFSDNGVFYSVNTNYEINSHLKFQIMASQLKKIEPLGQLGQPNHRIFVQLILQ